MKSNKSLVLSTTERIILAEIVRHPCRLDRADKFAIIAGTSTEYARICLRRLQGIGYIHKTEYHCQYVATESGKAACSTETRRLDIDIIECLKSWPGMNSGEIADEIGAKESEINQCMAWMQIGGYIRSGSVTEAGDERLCIYNKLKGAA